VCLSGESAERVVREVLSEATPSTSGSRPLPRVNRSWKALSYFSKINQDDIDRIRRRYQIPDDVVLRIPDLTRELVALSMRVTLHFMRLIFQAGLRFPYATFCEGAFRLSISGTGASGPEWLADDHIVYGHVEG
jgi:hypothetical protein